MKCSALQKGVTRYAETDTFVGPWHRRDTIWVGPSGRSDGPDGQYETALQGIQFPFLGRRGGPPTKSS
jgi:hypothetical protein